MARANKYTPAELPTKEEALTMAEEVSQFAADARARDMHGTAHNFELQALLLRFYAEHS